MQFVLQKVVRVIPTGTTTDKLEHGREMKTLEPKYRCRSQDKKEQNIIMRGNSKYYIEMPKNIASSLLVFKYKTHRK